MRAFPLLALAIALAGAAPRVAAQPPEAGPTPTPRSAIERCVDFCAVIYGNSNAERGQCAAACRDADACSQLCSDRFPDDGGKQTACFKRCMRSKAT